MIYYRIGKALNKNSFNLLKDLVAAEAYPEFSFLIRYVALPTMLLGIRIRILSILLTASSQRHVSIFNFFLLFFIVVFV